MIALICLLAVLGLGNCLEQLPTRHEIESSINRTIDEVERMVRDNPGLPRLSRSQIVDILFNITSKDMNSYTDYVEKKREEYQRALMVVLPANSKDKKDESLKDLYTKAPTAQSLLNSYETPTRRPEILNAVSTLDNLINSKTQQSQDSTEEPPRSDWKNHRQTYAEVSMMLPTKETIRKLLDGDKNHNPAPERFSFNLESFETNKDKKEPAKPFFTNFLGPRNPDPSKSGLEIVYSTSVTQRPTVKMVQTSASNFEAFRPTMTPTKTTHNVLTSDQWHYNAPPSTTTMKPRKQSSTEVKHLNKSKDVPFLPTMITESDEAPTKASSTLDPQGFTSTRMVYHDKSQFSPWDMEHMRILNENEKPSPVYVTPMSSTTSAKLGGFFDIGKIHSTTDKPMLMREEVKDLLASIGLRPKKTEVDGGKSKNKVSDHQDEIFGANFQIPEANNGLLGQASALTAVGVESPSILGQNTFENTPHDVRKGVSNLSPDVQLLFQRFGLQNSAKDLETDLEITTTTTTTEKPLQVTSVTSFWNSFKPLPTSEVKDQGMKDFLAKFGLGVKETRNEKAMKTKKNAEDKPRSLIEAVPANMKNILENIGLITRTHEITEAPSTEPPELHVFKPHETSFDDEKQRTKINELLDTVKKVQEGKADVLAVQTVAKELLETTKSLKNGPDPLSLEEILKIYNDDVKNEIKRQQNPKELADMAASETSDATSTVDVKSNATSASIDAVIPATSLDSSSASSDGSAGSAAAADESMDSLTDVKVSDTGIEAATTETANLAALADSFGGSTAAPDPVLPTRRKTGLYFLVDWNTFLEVGEEGVDKVNLRFQPKAGDRTRFLPVTVP